MPSAKVTLCCLSVVCAAAAPAQAQISVFFNDPAAIHAPYYADLQRLTVAAGKLWTGHFMPGAAGADLSVEISFAAIATATGRSLTSAPVGTSSSGQNLYEQGAAFEWRTGVDSNGAAPDVQITLGNLGYLQQELWFDPDTSRASGSVPANRTDAFSVLLHEWGHAWGFNGWLDARSGLAPGNWASTFDAWVTPQQSAAGVTLTFGGPRAVSLYGAAVPLTFGNYAHLGNGAARDGLDLMTDLMNGEAFYRGTRYNISALDLAIMGDAGLPLALVSGVPEPLPLLLWLAGAVTVMARAGRRRQPICGPAAPSDRAVSPA